MKNVSLQHRIVISIMRSSCIIKFSHSVRHKPLTEPRLCLNTKGRMIEFSFIEYRESMLDPKNLFLLLLDRTKHNFTSPRLASPHLTSPQLNSTQLTSSHLTSPHLTSPHLTSPKLISSQLTSPHLFQPYLI
jgi:hypothetical protein